MEVTDDKVAGTVVSVYTHLPLLLKERLVELIQMKGVLLTKYKSYADAHLLTVEQCRDVALVNVVAALFTRSDVLRKIITGHVHSPRLT
ncbi:hypothetical protein INR49_005194 [Caranx melampygus]|nr:hypothetical protein INR49_005194 [Caranx melampygus]